jgi:hypothetical protein
MRYDSIDKLPLGIYFDCLFDNKYDLLSDNPDDDVVALWHDLNGQYTAALKNPDITAYTVLVNLRNKEYVDLKIIHMCVYVLTKVYDSEMIEILKYHGFNFRFDINDEEAYLKDLEKVKKRSNAKVRRIEQLDMEISNTIKESRDEEFTRHTLNSNLANLSKFMGFAIDESSTTTGRYIGMLNLYYSHIETLRNAKHG